MSETTIALGQQIRFLRQQKGWTQEVLAEKADLHVSYIIALEQGKKSATVDSLKKLAEGFGITLAELFAFDSVATTQEDYQISALMQEYTLKIKSILVK